MRRLSVVPKRRLSAVCIRRLIAAGMKRLIAAGMCGFIASGAASTASASPPPPPSPPGPPVPHPVPHLIAPSAIPPQCLWLPVFGYAPVPVAFPPAAAPAQHTPALTPPLHTGPNWFFTVPAWQTLATPPTGAAPAWPLGPCPTGTPPWPPYPHP